MEDSWFRIGRLERGEGGRAGHELGRKDAERKIRSRETEKRP